MGGGNEDADASSGIAFALTKNRLAPYFETAVRVAKIVSEATAALS